MLRIRFSRTGKRGQPSYRIVVAERAAAVKGRFLEILGHYMPARNPKVSSLKKERILHWISKGAIPTDSAASLLKKEGFENMDIYLEPRNKQHKPKGEEEKPKEPVAKEPAAKEASAKEPSAKEPAAKEAPKEPQQEPQPQNP